MLDEVHALLTRPNLRIHMVGIGGVGMAGLARLLQQKGHQVTGSELTPSSLTDWLQGVGVAITFGHDPALVHPELDLVIRTTAAPLDHPECTQAAELAIPLVRRGEALPALLHDTTLIAVTGTHGKTSTTAMITHIFRMHDLPAGHFVGGESAQLGSVADLNEIMVVEADESDGTLVNYHPDILVITNIEFDHMEHFADEQEMLAVFTQAVQQSKTVVYCARDKQATALCKDLPHAIPYAGGEIDFEAAAHSSQFTYGGKKHRLGVPGFHNALNALGAFAVAERCEVMAPSLEQFAAVDRRYQLIAESATLTVISDYAHHPTEIRAVLEMAQALPRKRIMAIYQPHRYTRTKMLGDQFPAAFADVDLLILAPVYAASEAPMEGGTSADLAARIPGCLLANSLEHAWELAQENLTPNDALLILGAGDVVKIAAWAQDFVLR
jgi:UDP-N-acetylmuramate--alanine ligase